MLCYVVGRPQAAEPGTLTWRVLQDTHFFLTRRAVLCCAERRRRCPQAAEPGTPTRQILQDTAPVTPARTEGLQGNPPLPGVHSLPALSHVSKVMGFLCLIFSTMMTTSRVCDVHYTPYSPS